jgi:hypothetical protein
MGPGAKPTRSRADSTLPPALACGQLGPNRAELESRWTVNRISFFVAIIAALRRLQYTASPYAGRRIMSVILELRNHVSHAGTPLVHPASEDVLLSNVFGVVKNLPAKFILTPWVRAVTELEVADAGWTFNFWEKQPRPIGIREGNTTVDLVLDSDATLIFVEVKMDALASSGTTHDPNRNQLVRNLDIGYRRAADAGKQFALIFVTPDTAEPGLIPGIRSGSGPFPVNSAVAPSLITSCLHWAAWASIGDVIADARAQLSDSESKFALDLLAYLAHKRLWKNRLPDEPGFYSDKLYRSLRSNTSPFVPYAEQRPERYQAWRQKAWDETRLRELLGILRPEDKALLKLVAEAGGAIRQDDLMLRLPMLHGKTSASLRAMKAHVNGECKQLDCAPLLSEGSGSGPSRRHEINPMLGSLRDVVITVAKSFEIDWHLFEQAATGNAQLAVHIIESLPGTAPRRVSAPSQGKAWYVTRQTGTPEIAAFVNAKGSCSYRRFKTSGEFIDVRRSKGDFVHVFSAVVAHGVRFFPNLHPALEGAEKNGLPTEVLAAANKILGNL